MGEVIDLSRHKPIRWVPNDLEELVGYEMARRTTYIAPECVEPLRRERTREVRRFRRQLALMNIVGIVVLVLGAYTLNVILEKLPILLHRL